MLDVYDFSDPAKGLDPDVYLCHGYCTLGAYRLTDALQDIKDFLDTHPDEVISIIFESYVHIDELVSRFTAVGLDPYLHVQAVGQPWPTLNQMIDAGHRLVVFSDRVDAPRPGYHYVWSFAVETPFSASQPSDLTCNRNRGSDANPLFILNHFLTQTIGSPTLASEVNYNPFFVTRAIQCWSERQHLPNFVTVDFYDIGDVLPVVDELNRDRLLSSTPPPTLTPTPSPTPFLCSSAPNPACATPTRAGLRIRRTKAGATLRFRWRGGVAGADVGDPLSSTDFALCLYADDLNALQLNLPAGSAWRAVVRHGVTRRYSYKSVEGTPDGVDKAAIRLRETPHGRIMVHADGSRLQLPPALMGATSATRIAAQLVPRDGAHCWSADFTGDVVRPAP
jgi:hypothetical protein